MTESTAAQLSRSTGAGTDPDGPGRGTRRRILSPYVLAVALSLLALSPFIVLTTATEAVSDLISRDLDASPRTLAVASGLANAGYALGAVVAADLAQRFVQRRLFLGYEALFVLASLASGTGPRRGRLHGGAHRAGLRHGADACRRAAPLDPALPVEPAARHRRLRQHRTLRCDRHRPLRRQRARRPREWRALLLGAAALGALGWVAGWFGYETWPANNPGLPLDKAVFPLAVAATFLPFLGSALVATLGFASPWFWAPIALGLLALLVLIGYEYRHRDEPLMPVRALSSALPVAGTLGAMLGGGAFVAALSLTTLLLAQRGTSLVTAGRPAAAPGARASPSRRCSSSATSCGPVCRCSPHPGWPPSSSASRSCCP